MTLSHKEQDVLLAGGLVTSPAWAPWLSDLNELLTTATLLVGLALGLARLWRFAKRRRRNIRRP